MSHMATIICMRANTFRPGPLPRDVTFLRRPCGTCSEEVVVSARVLAAHPDASLACLACAPDGECEVPPEALEEARRILGRVPS